MDHADYQAAIGKRYTIRYAQAANPIEANARAIRANARHAPMVLCLNISDPLVWVFLE